MAFTCEPCHKKPIVTLCFVGHVSYGRCENCGMRRPCSDCQCPTLIAERGIFKASDLTAPSKEYKTY